MQATSSITDEFYDMVYQRRKIGYNVFGSCFVRTEVDVMHISLFYVYINGHYSILL